MRKILLVNLSLIVLVLGCGFAQAQTSAFTYQGKLTDLSAPASGNYDFTFRLFDAASGGAQIGADAVADDVQVTNGIFTVNLDFGAAAFTGGAARYLEISVRAGASTGAFQPLAPRQEVTSSPFSIKSLFSTDALQLGGIAAGQYVLTSDTRLSDDRNPLPNSANYIRNGTMSQSASFDISGNGTASIFNATNRFDINGLRVLGVPGTNNLFVGIGAGELNTGINNSFFGSNAGNVNSSGNTNSFFGTSAGFFNTEGSGNSFFGYRAGSKNTIHFSNTFIGANAGLNTGSVNLGGGNENTFVGASAGSVNTWGSNNIAIGSNANFATGNLANAIVIGANATVAQSHSMVLGNDFINVGIGTSAPGAKLDISGTGIVRTRINSDSNSGLLLSLNNQPGWAIATVTGGQFQIYNDALGSNALAIDAVTNRVGIGTTAPDQLLSVNGNASKPGGGSWAVFSDERLKNINGRFTRGLGDLMRLNPIRYEYKPDNALGLRGMGEYVGFSAQELAFILPEAVNRSESGYLQINNDPILWTMLNAVKEQQAQIEAQQKQIDALKLLVCELKPEAAICGEERK